MDKSPTINEGDLKQRSCCAQYFSGGIHPPREMFMGETPKTTLAPQANFTGIDRVKLAFTTN